MAKAESKKKTPNKKVIRVRDTKVNESLKCILSDDEIKVLGEELAKQVRDKAELEQDKKSNAAGFKARIDATEATQLVTSNKLRDGYEYRGVPCTKHWDWKKQIITVTRDDTKEVLEDRAMTLGEKADEGLFDSKEVKNDPEEK